MSKETVEVVKRSVEAQWRGDIDAYLEELGDDAGLDFSRARGPYRGVHRGREGAREFFAGFREAFSSITPLSTEYMEVGDKVVLAARVRFRGRGSGVEVGGGGMGAVYTLRDGKIVRSEQFQSKAEALRRRAAGVGGATIRGPFPAHCATSWRNPLTKSLNWLGASMLQT